MTHSTSQQRIVMIFVGLLMAAMSMLSCQRSDPDDSDVIWDESQLVNLFSSEKDLPNDGPWEKFGPGATIISNAIINGKYGFDPKQNLWVLKVDDSSMYVEELHGVYTYKYRTVVTGNYTNEWRNQLQTIVILTNKEELPTYMQLMNSFYSSYKPAHDEWTLDHVAAVQSIYWEAPYDFPPGEYTEE